MRARVDNERDVEIVVPDGAGAGCVLRVRGALRCEGPRGSYVGAPVAVPRPDAESQLRGGGAVRGSNGGARDGNEAAPRARMRRGLFDCAAAGVCV